jgi:uncharacterized protein YjbI with pentapeptide repeats
MAENKDDIKSGIVKRLWEWIGKHWKRDKFLVSAIIAVPLLGIGLLLIYIFTAAELIEAVRVWIFSVGLIGGGYGLVLAAIRTEKFATQVENSQAQLFNDRLGRGVELLSNEELTLRSAGVRILEDLGGNSSPQQINLIINILNDFLNSKGKLGEVRKEQDGDFKICRYAPISMKKTSREERIDLENCLNTILKLAERLGEDNYYLALKNLDLRKLQFQSSSGLPISLRAKDCDFSEADINLANINDITIWDCNLSKTTSEGVSLSYVRLSFCYGYMLDIHRRKLDAVSFYSSNLCRGIFKDSIFSGVAFEGCRLDGTNFTGATFEDVKFKSCTFLCTDFSGVDLAGTSGITQEEFSKIIYDKDNPPTNIPKDLELPKDRTYERRESYPYECFVKSDDEQLRGRRVSEVLDELLKEQDGYYQKSLPPSGG